MLSILLLKVMCLVGIFKHSLHIFNSFILLNGLKFSRSNGKPFIFSVQKWIQRIFNSKKSKEWVFIPDEGNGEFRPPPAAETFYFKLENVVLISENDRREVLFKKTLILFFSSEKPVSLFYHSSFLRFQPIKNLS